MDKNRAGREYLECGKAVSTHGIKGNIRLESWCDTPHILASLKTLYTKKSGSYIPHKVKGASVQKNMVLASLEGVDSLEKAIMMKGTVFFASRDELSRLIGTGDVFVADMIGLPVIDADTGYVYGHLTEVKAIGIHDVYVIERPEEFGEIQKEAMIPAVDEFIRKIEIGDGIYIKPIGGFFEPHPDDEKSGGKENPDEI